MNISEDELQALVRAAVARHVRSVIARDPGHPTQALRHPSHVLLRLAPGSDTDGSCLIEPAVACTHCGYCQSYGH